MHRELRPHAVFPVKGAVLQEGAGLAASARESVAVVGDAPVPRAVSLKWNLLYLPVIAVTLAIGAVGYAQMPDLIPQHMNFQGEVTEYMEKTPFTILVPALIVAFVAACMAFAHWTILRSKRPSNPSAPATSALAYGMFAVPRASCWWQAAWLSACWVPSWSCRLSA